MKKMTPLAVLGAAAVLCAAGAAGFYLFDSKEAGSAPLTSVVSGDVHSDRPAPQEGAQASPCAEKEGAPVDKEKLTRGYQAWAERKYEAAAESFKKIAEEGSPQGMTALGFLYLSGTGCEVDVEKGLSMYRMAAAAGEPYAMYGLAEYLRSNPSCEKEPGEGLTMLKTAALEKKLPAACRDYYEFLRSQGKNDEAQTYLKENAKEGQNWAMTTLGIALCDGPGNHLDVEEGLKLLKKAAQNGDVTASYCAGCVELRRGRKGSAELLFRSAAKQMYGPALLELGRMELQRGELKKGKDLLKKAGEHGSPEAFVLLGKACETGQKEEKDPLRAAQYYKMAADADDGSGYNELARLTEIGLGVPQSFEEAYRLYSAGAEAGSSEALYNQGRMEILGRGTEKNPASGVEKLRRAAGRGESGAKTALASLYVQGIFLDKDLDEAERLYRLAAAQGDREAQYRLGEMLRREDTDESFEEAMKFYRLAADQGCADAQYALGQCYADGRRGSPDMEGAVKWYMEAAHQNHPAALCAVGLLRLDSAKNDGDVKEAVGLVEKAAKSGYMPARYALGQICEEGRLGKNAIPKALEHYRVAARGGNADSQLRMASIAAHGEFNVPVNFGEALKWYLEAARQGNAAAQCNAAAMYAEGRGTEKDPKQAAAWYQAAAEHGSVQAQYNLGLMKLRGVGIERQKDQGMEWLEKAATGGYAAAQNELGVLYAEGREVKYSYDTACRWLQKAAESGYAPAQFNLGLLYSYSDQSDLSAAASCFEQAAAQGHALAAWYLGCAYEAGRGVAKDVVRARECYQTAADAGCDRAAQSLERLGVKPLKVPLPRVSADETASLEGEKKEPEKK